MADSLPARGPSAHSRIRKWITFAFFFRLDIKPSLIPSDPACICGGIHIGPDSQDVPRTFPLGFGNDVFFFIFWFFWTALGFAGFFFFFFGLFFFFL